MAALSWVADAARWAEDTRPAAAPPLPAPGRAAGIAAASFEDAPVKAGEEEQQRRSRAAETSVLLGRRAAAKVKRVEDKKFYDEPAEKRRLQRNEWSGVLLRIKNSAIIVLGIICLQLPFELAYAHLYEKLARGAEVLENLIENSIPYLKYSYKKYSVVRKKRQERESPSGKSVRLSTRVEKEYLKLSYTASIGAELEYGLFDDFLELALQFGMIMMFACAFPLIFCFAALVCGYDDSLQSSTHA
ncbi:hypothetical protein ZWY2020_030519 [Hordeum vulgare]|nr:hypothetical protein ZWY2020_030519 [Hordeum vulgare]